ncbi:hypothetical protein [Streptomyces sp. NPDC002758]
MAQLGLGFRVLGQQFLEPRGRRLLCGSDRDRVTARPRLGQPYDEKLQFGGLGTLRAPEGSRQPGLGPRVAVPDQ